MGSVVDRSSIFAFLLAMVRDPGLAAEAMRRLSPGAESIPKAREIAIALCRKRKREILLTPASLDALERAASGASAVPPDVLSTALAQVDRQARSLLAMRYRDGMGLEQIARWTKTTVAKAQKSLHRARTSLAQAIAERTRARTP
jgi:DNA-directed RNA polymerase specialized sigma24 family protein